MNAIAEALNSAPTTQEALDRTLALVAGLLGLRTGWIWLLDPESGQFYSAAARSLPPYLREPVRMTGGSCWCIDEFRAGGVAARNIHLMHCSRLSPAVRENNSEATEGLCCHATIPLYFRDKPLGIMNVTAPEWRELTAPELRLLSTIAYQVGIAIERARLAEESARLARAEERTRLAREIHDTLAQGLTAIALHLEGALPHLTQRPDVARERLERALAMARENLEDARRSVRDLRAAPLDGKPLGEALRALGRGFTGETGVRVAARIEAGTDGLPHRVEAELYRIAQEALANVRRHARATRVLLTLQRRGDRIRLAVRDDGQGFDPAQEAEGRQGILGMRERARLANGRLRVVSRPGRGTAVVADIPAAEPPP